MKKNIYTFGNTKRPSNYRCRRVELTLQSQYSTSKVTVEALEVSELCTVMTPPLDNMQLRLGEEEQILGQCLRLSG